MTFDEYQDHAMKLAIYPDRGTGKRTAISYVALGLAGESGEVAEKVKKLLRGDIQSIDEEFRAVLIKEVGDVLWYVTAMAHELRFSLEDVARLNLDKLYARANRGTLQGSGDDR